MKKFKISIQQSKGLQLSNYLKLIPQFLSALIENPRPRIEKYPGNYNAINEEYKNKYHADSYNNFLIR